MSYIHIIVQIHSDMFWAKMCPLQGIRAKSLKYPTVDEIEVITFITSSIVQLISVEFSKTDLLTTVDIYNT